MKGNTYRLKICFCIFLGFSTLVQSQDRHSKNSEFVKSFFEDVFNTNNDISEIVESYCKKDYYPDFYKKFVKYLREEHKYLWDKSINFKVDSYHDITSDEKQKFPENVQNDIYIVTIGEKIEFYVLIKNSKIISFDYLIKFEEGIFVVPSDDF